MAAVEARSGRGVDPERVAREHAEALVRYARRIVWSVDDAEDAWQRTLEILLRECREVDPEWVGAWLHVVVKHECLAILRQRKHIATADRGEGEDLDGFAALNLPGEEELCERLDLRERARRDLPRLKPQERRALGLFAQGYGYREICAATGWSYTKVNRCVTEGRAALRGMEPRAA